MSDWTFAPKMTASPEACCFTHHATLDKTKD